MPEYRAPGVYVEEVDRGPKAIEGVSTSTAAFLGECERGPTDPEFLTSFADFERTFGGFDLYKEGAELAGTYLAYAVRGFFGNGGKRAYVGRITDETETASTMLKVGESDLALVADTTDFGDVITGHESEPATLTLTNLGGRGDPPVTISASDVRLVDPDADPPSRSTEFDWELLDDGGEATEFPDRGLRIQPDRSRTLRVTFKPRSVEASKRATLQIDHTGTNPTAEETFRGDGIAPSEGELDAESDVDPDDATGTIDFGEVVTGHESDPVTVMLTNLGDPGQGHDDITIDVDSVQIVEDPDADPLQESPAFDWELLDDPDGQVDPGESKIIEVRFTPESAGADTTGSLLVPHSGVDDMIEVAFSGDGITASPDELDASTDEIEFDATFVDRKSDSETVMLTNLGDPTEDPSDPSIIVAADEDIRIVEDPAADPLEDSPAFEWELLDDAGSPVPPPTGGIELGPGESRDVRVQFSPESAGTDTTGALRIPHSGTNSPVEVTLEGDGFDPAPLDVSPLSANFEQVRVDETSDPETVTLEHAGDGDSITVSDVGIVDPGGDAGEFDPELRDGDLPVELDPGDSQEIDVTFTPEDERPKSATLEVSYAAGAGPTERATVRLEGNKSTLGVEVVGPGNWGERVAVTVENAALYKPGENELFKLRIRYWTNEEDRQDAETHGLDAKRVADPDVDEVYDNLSPVQTSSDYYENRVTDVSELVEVARRADGRPRNGTTWLGFPDGGADGNGDEDEGPTVDDYMGNETPGERTGLAAFEEIDDISIVCVPDEARDVQELQGLTDAIVNHCEERMQDRFAVLQSERRAGDVEDLEPPMDTKYAAFYHPWIKVRDPVTNLKTPVPPGGHVAGIYARSDRERGVHKAPANEVVRGVQELQLTITHGEQEILNPKGVNCIRSFSGRGIRVWGARTASSDPSWKYVNVRRLFLYLEESIDEGTQWVVFEPNDENLWARVRQTISNFLTTAWRDGALMGTSPDEAFYVKCDRSTMTQDDIDNGRLICEIGVAPVKPAEFVIFRISQWTGGAD